jgi:glycosyltransferase involved in cell wall biosynthesis
MNQTAIKRPERNVPPSLIDQREDSSGEQPAEVLDVHAVILVNYIRIHHVLAFQEFAKRVRKLTVLLSVPMEPDREWDTQWGDLDVQVQKNLMWTSKWRHSSGFAESNFIHFPIDTLARLRKLKPDVVLSYEMGARTMLSSFYRKAPLVMVGNMSEHIEKERGILRRTFRKLICRSVDFFTYNGPSCKRYLNSMGIPDNRLFHFPYCINNATVFDGEKSINSGGKLKLLYCGAISPRKGIVQFTDSLAKWCSANPSKGVELLIAGSGDLRDKVAAFGNDSLSINFLGNCNTEQLREAYGEADICVFPSLADEWGLVPIEAVASGLPVLGSIHAQSVEACCEESVNGWTFDPNCPDDTLDAIERALTTPRSMIEEMGQKCKESVAHITPHRSGNLLADAVAAVMKTIN